MQGLRLVFASQFAQLLPAQLSNQYLSAAIEVIEAPQASIPMKLSAIKVAKGKLTLTSLSSRCSSLLYYHNFHCTGLDSAITVPFAPCPMCMLGPFLLATLEDMLNLIMDTFMKVLGLNNGSWLASDLATLLTQVLLEVWSKNAKGALVPFHLLAINALC